MKSKRRIYSKIFLYLLVLCLIIFRNNYSLGNEWSKTFGGEEDEQGYSVHQTTDGGFIIVGVTSSFGAGKNDVYLIKTDKNGNEQWSKTFGGEEDDIGYSVQQTTDRGFIIVGSTKSSGAGENDVYLIKTDENGNEQWSKTFGGSDFDLGSSVQQTADGGYVIVGLTASFSSEWYIVYLIKTDENGNEQWYKTFGIQDDNWGLSVEQTADSGFII